MASSSSAVRVGCTALFLMLTGGGTGQAQWAAVRYVDAGYVMGGTRDKGGYLGITFRDVNDGEVGSLRLKDAHGAEIMMVDHDGPAGQAGLHEHDVVLSMNGVTVEGEDQLRRMLRDLQPGRSVSMLVCHEGTEHTVNATLANRAELEKKAWQKHWTVPQPAAQPQDEASFPAPPEAAAAQRPGFGRSFMPGHLLPLTAPYTGATVDVMGAQLADYFGVHDGKGLLVHEVEGNSPAAVAGLHAGDVVTKVNGGVVATKSDWNRALHDGKGKAVSLTVIRDRREQTLTMNPETKKRSSVEEPQSLRVPAMMLR